MNALEKEGEACNEVWEFGGSGGQIALLNKVVRIDLIEMVIFEQKLEGVESHREI